MYHGPPGGIPGGVAGIVTDELTKGYRSVSGMDCALRDMAFAVRAEKKARSCGAEGGVSRWCERRKELRDRHSCLAG